MNFGDYSGEKFDSALGHSFNMELVLHGGHMYGCHTLQDQLLSRGLIDEGMGIIDFVRQRPGFEKNDTQAVIAHQRDHVVGSLGDFLSGMHPTVVTKSIMRYTQWVDGILFGKHPSEVLNSIVQVYRRGQILQNPLFRLGSPRFLKTWVHSGLDSIRREMFETILNNEYYLLQPRLQDPQNFPETIDRAIRSALGKVAFLCQNSLCDTNTSFGLLTEVVGRISAKAGVDTYLYTSPTGFTTIGALIDTVSRSMGPTTFPQR